MQADRRRLRRPAWAAGGAPRRAARRARTDKCWVGRSPLPRTRRGCEQHEAEARRKCGGEGGLVGAVLALALAAAQQHDVEHASARVGARKHGGRLARQAVAVAARPQELAHDGEVGVPQACRIQIQIQIQGRMRLRTRGAPPAAPAAPVRMETESTRFIKLRFPTSVLLCTHTCRMQRLDRLSPVLLSGCPLPAAAQTGVAPSAARCGPRTRTLTPLRAGYPHAAAAADRAAAGPRRQGGGQQGRHHCAGRAGGQGARPGRGSGQGADKERTGSGPAALPPRKVTGPGRR